MAVCTYSVIGRGGWQGTAVGQGLPEDFIGYDLKTLCSENGHDLGLLYRTEIVNYIMEDCNGLIGASTGVKKDGRVIRKSSLRAAFLFENSEYEFIL